MNFVFLRTTPTTSTRSSAVEGALADPDAGGGGGHQTCPIPNFVVVSFGLDSFLPTKGSIMRDKVITGVPTIITRSLSTPPIRTYKISEY